MLVKDTKFVHWHYSPICNSSRDIPQKWFFNPNFERSFHPPNMKTGKNKKIRISYFSVLYNISKNQNDRRRTPKILSLLEYGIGWLQWRAKVFGRPLKLNNFFKINPNDLIFIWEAREISLLNDVIRRFEKNAHGRNNKKNSKGRFFSTFFCEPLMKIQKTRL